MDFGAASPAEGSNAEMSTQQTLFRVSSGLKDLIGKDLITDDFVAVFELVKNSFDAHAKQVHLLFEEDRIVIADDGKGMSRADILNKWLFVAYSAKRDGTEDKGYRRKFDDVHRTFAGAKGVGRFSCDRLGSTLRLSSCAEGQRVQVLEIDWLDFENTPKKEFSKIPVKLSTRTAFPNPTEKVGGPTGTILEISNLRSEWDRTRLQALKRELTKLIDPFSGNAPRFRIEINAPQEEAADEKDRAYNSNRREHQEARLIVNGLIENPILDVIAKRTTGIHVTLTDKGSVIESTLEDRGDIIYRIREPNPYPRIADAALRADIFFLNHSAKTVFKHRMGIAVIQFGSIFLFRNGFRVLPIGAEDDDFFGLNRRKQQGQRRYLGGRDLIGRIEVKGVKGFNEATSRNQGLIHTPQVEDLLEFVRDKCVKRLERYVVDITWKDTFDKNTADTSRIRLDESSALVAQLVSRLAATEGVELLDYNSDIVRIVDEKSSAFSSSFKALEILADETGNPELLARVDEARVRLQVLERAEAEAREAEQRAEMRAKAAEQAASVATEKYAEERQRSAFLVAASSLDQDTVLNLHHQIMIHAADVHHDVRLMMGRMRSGVQFKTSDWVDFLERVSYRNSQILTAARFATKGGYKQLSAIVKDDICVYIRDYIETVSRLWVPRGISISVDTDSKKFLREFRPIDVGIVIDNLVTNAAKAHATKVLFVLRVGKGAKPMLTITVADDGDGWSASLSSLDGIFEKGVTTTDGSGLGLFHVKQVIQSLGGTIEAHRNPYSSDFDGAQLFMQVST